MQAPQLFQPVTVKQDTTMIPAYLPVPGAGVLPASAFLLRSREPVLVDTGLASMREGFLEALGSVLDPSDLRWIWITHTDADHVGNLEAVLDIAPQARVVTTFLGMAKMGLLGLSTDRVHLVNPGQSLDVGDRSLLAVAPPTFDAPETTGLFDPRTRTLFSADCFGALMEAPAEDAAALPAEALREGMLAWSVIDAPWLHRIDATAFARSLDTVRDLGAESVLSSHLPPAHDLTETLLRNLAAAPQAAPFVGPDQAAFEQLMAVAAG